MVLSAVLTGISSAQLMPSPDGAMEPDLAIEPEPSEGRMMHGEEMPPMGVPVEMVVGGGGFAFQDNETHLLRLSVVRLSPLDPGRIRDLLVSNKSIEEIREAVKAEEGQALYRGSMKLDDVVYPMTNIDVRPSGDNATTVDADIAMPGSDPENQTSVVGHLSVTVSASKGGRIGEGKLDMNSAEHEGSYQVLLDMERHAMLFKGTRDHTESEKDLKTSIMMISIKE
ncbi:MAG TPA: hypothetical protein VLB04_11805 [Methanotrichaceae archaeon]|nr:hypothetical protein [Methanotrichaceae archaeon]